MASQADDGVLVAAHRAAGGRGTKMLNKTVIGSAGLGFCFGKLRSEQVVDAEIQRGDGDQDVVLMKRGVEPLQGALVDGSRPLVALGLFPEFLLAPAAPQPAKGFGVAVGVAPEAPQRAPVRSSGLLQVEPCRVQKRQLCDGVDLEPIPLPLVSGFLTRIFTRLEMDSSKAVRPRVNQVGRARAIYGLPPSHQVKLSK